MQEFNQDYLSDSNINATNSVPADTPMAESLESDIFINNHIIPKNSEIRVK
jgi:hypothetical protein